MSGSPLHVGGGTRHPCQSTVFHTRPYLCLIQAEDAKVVEVACHPTQGRDALEGLSDDGCNMVVEAQATVHGHSQDLDVLLDIFL